MKNITEIRERSSERHFVEMENGTDLSGIQKKLFLDRYSLKDENGKPLEMFPEQTWRRVAWAIAQVEESAKLRRDWEEKYFGIMQDFKFAPAGRFLTAAGTGTDTTMINCFVIPDPEDTRKGIIKTLEHVTEISARGGGVGFNISSLRPRGSYLKAVNGTSSGAVSWANLYSVSAHDIIQQGGTRRGALMIMMWDWHPDLEEFINIKKEQGRMVGANLSICISDKFMRAVSDDLDWDLKFPDTNFEKYRSEWTGDLDDWLFKGYPVTVYKTVKARYLWDMICQSAWESAEPGVVYMDRYNKMNNTWYFEKNIATNPCGEQGLPAWGVCNLGSLNMAAFVKFQSGEFDYELFEDHIKKAVRFLDDAIDSEKYLYKDIEDTQIRERRIGLGTMGLADALIKMKVRYGSDESLVIIDKMYKLLRETAYNTSVELAKEKGPFPMFDAKKYLQSGFMKTLPESIRENIRKNGIRNALLLTEAPTGKISMLAGVSSGIEPIFSFSYVQKDRLGERTIYHPLYQDWIDKNGRDSIPDYFVVADDLTPEEHVNIQSLIQKYTDSSISKTVNAPRTHTVEDVKKLYRLAYEKGCKGISYMREGSREGTLIRKEEKQAEVKKEPEVQIKPQIWERPIKVIGATYRLKTPVGTAFITVNHDNFGAPVELFINIGRAGSDIQAMAEALGRLISKSLRSSDQLTTRERAVLVIDQLMGIGGARTVGFGQTKIMSLPDAVAKAIAMDMGLLKDGHNEAHNNGVIHDHTEADHPENTHQLSIATPNNIDSQLALISHRADICPQCGNATLVHEMGCKTCHSCGYSEC